VKRKVGGFALFFRSTAVETRTFPVIRKEGLKLTLHVEIIPVVDLDLLLGGVDRECSSGRSGGNEFLHM